VTTPADERVTVGLVRGLHGLRGAVRIEVLSDEPERFVVGSVLFAEGDERPLKVVWTGPAKAGVLARFEELTTREAVEHLRDRYLEAGPGEPLPEGTYYWHELRGLAVTTTTGLDLGTIIDVFRAGEGEVYVVRGGHLGEIMVPGVRDVVVELDPSAGRMVVDPVALDLPDKPPRRRRRQEITRRSRKAAQAERRVRAQQAAKSTAAEPASAAPTTVESVAVEPTAAEPDSDRGDTADAVQKDAS